MDPSPGSTTHIQPIPCKNKEVYSELNTLIYEYLEVNGLEQALSTFTKECNAKNLPCPKLPSGNREVKAAFTHYDGDLLLKSFDEGELETFLKLWKQFQNHIQVTSEDMKKLEVYIRVHFAIYPKAKNHPEAMQTQAMQSLKQFFEDNSASLSSDTTILPLFALPFVVDPRPHPIFKDLFHENWTSKLRSQLETTVNKYFELLQQNITNHCKLASVVVKEAKGSPSNSTMVTPTVGPGQITTTANKSPARRLSVSKPNPASITNSTSGVTTNTVVGGLSSSSKKTNITTSVSAGTEVATVAATTSVTGDVIPQSLLKMTETAILYHQERFLQLLTIHRKTRKVLRGVRENYSKLLKVSSILITALERSLSTTNATSPISSSAAPPTTFNIDLILNQCHLIYPEIFTNPSSEASPSSSKPDLNHFKQLAAASTSTTSVNSTAVASAVGGYPSSSPVESSDVSLLFLGLPDISLETLNYSKMKEDLISEKLSVTDRLCLLQALRWLITKTPTILRASVMSSFIDNDLLGLKLAKSSSQNYSQKLFSYLLSPTPTYQKESLARLINAFASTWAGRTYLTSTTFIIDTLIRSLFTFKTQEESFICHMVIATLQKLSLRVKMRRFMIDYQVIPWLVKYIKTELERDQLRSQVNQAVLQSSASPDPNKANNNNNEASYGDATFNNYLMEYAWALLMNLSLHPESIKSAQTVDFEFLHCIVTMLTSRSSFDFIPYVLSTLFSLLRNPEFFDKAKSMDLNKRLAPVIMHQSPDIQRHLRHLLTQLYEKPNVDRLQASGETDYDDTDNPDPEEVEPELELQESWMVNNQMVTNSEQMLTGDDLLIREYILPKEMPLLYIPPSNNLNAPSSDRPPHTSSLSSQHNSVDSSFNSDKSSRENSRDTPPSKQPQDSSSPTIILRPTTPVHTKSPIVISKREEQRSTQTPRKDPLSASTPQTNGATPKNLNPFLQQFNNMRINTISHLIHHNSSQIQSSNDPQDEENEEEETEQIIKSVKALKGDVVSDNEDDDDHYEGPPTPHKTDSATIGKFTLHESALISFSRDPFLLEGDYSAKTN